MGSLNPLPNWSDPVVLVAIERAFDVTWPVIRAHEAKEPGFKQETKEIVPPSSALSVITSCLRSSNRRAMYLHEKP